MKNPILNHKYILSMLTFCCSLAQPAYATGLQNIDQINIKELNQVYVTTVSKKPEAQFKASSAITVISQEDLQRSGATNIAEALRLVPGVSVARIDSNKWAISIRGFNRQYSNKLLVLMDGRSLYNPLVSGVFWDTVDMALTNIDRIEIVRGPGATLWGANAVNGVINIITKKAQTTQGHHISATYGNHEDRTLTLQHGNKFNEHTFYRTFLKTVARDELRSASFDRGNKDESKQYRAGFRIDSSAKSLEDYVLQGNMYIGVNQQDLVFPGLVTPGVFTTVNGKEHYKGFNIQGQWNRQNTSTSHSLKSYIDLSQRKTRNLLHQKTLTFDIDYQKQIQTNIRNEVIWGVGYRYIWDDIEGQVINNNTYLFYDPKNKARSIYSSFIQNE